MASGADRLGALPDEVLHHVLSFLPAHEVVSTSVLARRWRHLWKTVPSLRVTGIRDCDNSPWFIRFVQNLLLLRDPGARLDSLELDLDGRDFQVKFLPYYARSVNLRLRLALLCQAQVLSLRTTSSLYEYEVDSTPLELPNVPIISQHLKRLDLELVTLASSTLDFSGCPELVDLKMKNCEIHGNIKSPFLKRLSITGCYFAYGSFRTRIYLPGLDSLVLSDFGSRTPLLDSMPLLVSAVVRVTSRCLDYCPKSSYGDCDDHTCFGCHNSDGGADEGRGESMLLKSLYQVTELELSVHSKVFIVNRDLDLCPKFPKLKTLLLSEWCPGIAADLNMLACFLQHSPILEKLTLQVSKVPKVPVQTERSFEPLEQSFACGHLKIVEIKCSEVDRRIHKTFGILSTYGIPLEQVNIQQAIKLLDLVVPSNLPIEGKDPGLWIYLLSP